MKTRQISQSSRLGEPQLITDSVDLSARVVNPDAIQARVKEAYAKIGHLLDDEEDAALLSDILCSDTPLIGASKGFTNLTGFPLERVLGCNCRMMLHGVPEVAISKSVRKNLRDFSRMCQMRRLDHISEVTSLQPNARADGTQFVNFFLIGLVKVWGVPYLLGVQLPVGEGLFVTLNGRLLEQVTESVRTSYKRLREKLLRLDLALGSGPGAAFEPAGGIRRTPVFEAPGFHFFSDRLQDHCLLLNGSRTAMRREPQELATNCLVFGSAPVRKTAEGIFFAIRVDDAVQTFEGLPMMGFTRRQPVDRPDLYPTVCRCLGASVLVGACGEAFARDQWEHFKIGFKPPPQTEVASWSTQPAVPPHKRRPPVSVTRGDIYGCMYTKGGHIQFWRNDAMVLDFDTGRPLDEDVEYYAVIDVCLSVYAVSLMPWWETSQILVGETDTVPRSLSGSECRQLSNSQEIPRPLGEAGGGGSEQARSGSDQVGEPSKPSLASDTIDAIISDVVNHALVTKAILAAVSQCQFCVTIADPRGTDIPLIAVSEAFESMTGYSRSEILGVNCRFLNQGCPISPSDLAGLRLASDNGSAFTALLPNRKKSGEMFVNLLDLRGLTIAHQLETDEELWYLIGIQADVTGLAECKVPEDHLKELQEIATLIRTKLAKELSKLAAQGAEQLDRQPTSSSAASTWTLDTKNPNAWKLLQEPVWRSGSLTHKAIMDLATKKKAMGSVQWQRPVEQNSRAESFLQPIGFFNAGVVLVSIVSFLTGLLLGRGSRRQD